MSLENVRVDTVIDLRALVVRLTTAVKISGLERGGVYHAAFSSAAAETLHHFAAETLSGTSPGAVIRTRVADTSACGSEAGSACYALDLPPDTSNFILRSTHAHALVPQPAAILQGDTQWMVYTGSAYFYSPYPTAALRTTMRLGPVPVRCSPRPALPCHTLRDDPALPHSGVFSKPGAHSERPAAQSAVRPAQVPPDGARARRGSCS